MQKAKRPVFFFILFWFIILATGAGMGHAAQKIVVGTKEAPPFSMKGQDGQWYGISIDLWRQVAANLELDYEFREYDLAGLLDALEKGSVDAGVAALTITGEREKKFDFCHSFHSSGLGIATRPAQHNTWLAIFERFLSLAFLKVVSTLVLLLLLVGLLVWFFERQKNAAQFGGKTLHGIGSAFWWSAVTMTTVGYGDKTPQTLGGRIVGLIWMFTAVIVISGFTAAITSTLTVSQIQTTVKGIEDLRHVQVGSVGLSTSAAYLEHEHIPFLSFADPGKAMAALAAGAVDAVVYDAPMLRYIATQKLATKVIVLPIFFEKQQYGIGLPEGSPLREAINREILATIKKPQWQDLLYSYIGNVTMQ